MPNFSHVRRSAFAVGLAVLIATLAGSIKTARAGAFELLVTEAGGPTIPITDGGPLDTNPAVGVISVNTALLNPLLVHFDFISLSGVSNSPGTTQISTVSQSGTAQLIPGSPGASIQIDATDINFTQPAPGIVPLYSSASGTFTNAPAPNGEQVFTTWFNASNGLDATDFGTPPEVLPAQPIPTSSQADTEWVYLNTTTPFGLTNRTTIFLSGGTVGAPSQLQFTGSTSIPEPMSSLCLMVPIALTCLTRRRQVW